MNFMDWINQYKNNENAVFEIKYTSGNCFKSKIIRSGKALINFIENNNIQAIDIHYIDRLF